MKADNQISVINSTDIDVLVLKAIGKLKVLSCFTEHIKDANDYIETGNVQFEDDNYAIVDHIEGVIDLLINLKNQLRNQSEDLINNRTSKINLN